MSGHRPRRYPQSNDKIESWHRTVKRECIRPLTPLNVEDARRVVAGFVRAYNAERLHSGIGYITPRDRLEGRDLAIWEGRRRKTIVLRTSWPKPDVHGGRRIRGEKP